MWYADGLISNFNTIDMPDLKDVHFRIQDKRRQRREITKGFKDELTHNSEYQEIIEEMSVLKERKKSIENDVKANASADATKLDTLGLEIKADAELLADIAINNFMENKSATFVDELDQRWVPTFAVRFTKDEGQTSKAAMEEERAMSHPERTYVPSAEEEKAEDREMQPA